MSILKLGHPELHRVAAEVNDFGSQSLCEDVEQLSSFLYVEGGMGIASPQVGQNRRLFLIHSRPNERYPYAPESELMVFVNPQILEMSRQTEMGWESCLSVPGLRGQVNRSKTISVR